MISDSASDSPAGWYGKLPSLGDFATRRLPPHFVEAWDHWLAEGLADWQARDPAWLDAYLKGPSWRFLLAPGAIDGQAWVGVMMPSVDQVGRYYPLCLACARVRLPVSPERLQSLLDWLLRLDDVALDAMQEDWPIDTLEDELLRLGHWPETAADCVGALAYQVADLIAADAAATLWLGRDTVGETSVYHTRGMPDRSVIGALLSGHPQQPHSIGGVQA